MNETPQPAPRKPREFWVWTKSGVPAYVETDRETAERYSAEERKLQPSEVIHVIEYGVFEYLKGEIRIMDRANGILEKRANEAIAAARREINSRVFAEAKQAILGKALKVASAGLEGAKVFSDFEERTAHIEGIQKQIADILKQREPEDGQQPT